MAKVASRSKPLAWLQPAVLTGALVPLVALLFRAVRHTLGPNPVATALNQLGLLALVFLVASLACTPLKLVFNVNWPLRLKKTLGLLAFFTALAHFLTYLVVDQRLALARIGQDLTKRPFIVVGFISLLLLTPLALTSTKASVARLGFALWKRIHRLAYVAVVFAILHFYLRVKADHTEPLVYAGVVVFGFIVRMIDSQRKTRVGKHRAKASLVS